MYSKNNGKFKIQIYVDIGMYVHVPELQQFF